MNVLYKYLVDKFLKIIRTYGYSIDIKMRGQLNLKFKHIFQSIIFANNTIQMLFRQFMNLKRE